MANTHYCGVWSGFMLFAQACLAQYLTLCMVGKTDDILKYFPYMYFS